MSWIDMLNDFHSRAIAEAYPESVRVLYDTLTYEFNKAFWPPELIYSERELSRLTCISPATIHRSLKFLSDRKYIKTWRTRNKTVFKLLGDAVPQPQTRSTDEANSEQSWSSREAKSLVCYTTHAKTKDFKTADRDEDASAKDVAGVTVAGLESYALTIPLNSPKTDANNIHNVWFRAFNTDLTGNDTLTLEMLANKDYAKTVTAIERTKAKNPTKPFAYFKAVYDGTPTQPSPKKKSVTTTDKDVISEQLRLAGVI